MRGHAFGQAQLITTSTRPASRVRFRNGPPDILSYPDFPGGNLDLNSAGKANIQDITYNHAHPTSQLVSFRPFSVEYQRLTMAPKSQSNGKAPGTCRHRIIPHLIFDLLSEPEEYTHEISSRPEI